MIHVGDCVETLRAMDPGSVQTCITSPPYFGLRDYGHEGQIGLEETPAAYVQRLVEVFREVRRVLRDDGTVWLNLGDSYCTNPPGNARPDHSGPRLTGSRGGQRSSGATLVRAARHFQDLKTKDLIGIPWRVAFALQDDGWYLRQDIIWHKPNPMPESVRDRCTKAHEYLFLLSKSPRYYFDQDAIKEPSTGKPPGNSTHKYADEYLHHGDEQHRTKSGLLAYAERQRSKRDSFKRSDSKRAQTIPGQSAGTHRPDRDESDYDLEARNKRSVWSVATVPFSGAHFAVFPPELIRPCVLAGAPEGGVVLDPFTGAGTTGVVCAQEGREFVGCEINPEYVALAERRIHEARIAGWQRPLEGLAL